jgi:hypothetical protein
MNGMTVVAGDTLDIMSGQIPENQVLMFPVAFKAFGRFLFGVGEPFAEDENTHASLPALLHVGGSRSVTGLTTLVVGRAVGDGFSGMGGDYVGVVPVFMAPFADFRAHGAVARPGFPSGQASPEEQQ